MIPKETLFEPGHDLAFEFFSRTVGAATSGEGQTRAISGSLRVLWAIGNVIVFTFTAARVKQEVAREGVLPFSLFFAASYGAVSDRRARTAQRARSINRAPPLRRLYIVLSTFSLVSLLVRSPPPQLCPPVNITRGPRFDAHYLMLVSPTHIRFGPCLPLHSSRHVAAPRAHLVQLFSARCSSHRSPSQTPPSSCPYFDDAPAVKCGSSGVMAWQLGRRLYGSYVRQ